MPYPNPISHTPRVPNEGKAKRPSFAYGRCGVWLGLAPWARAFMPSGRAKRALNVREKRFNGYPLYIYSFISSILLNNGVISLLGTFLYHSLGC